MTGETLDAVVGLGANLGDRLGNLQRALEALAERAEVRSTSRVYETAPVGPPQPSFLNAAAWVGWRGTAAGLLEVLLEVERSLGRVRRERWGPRIIDLDVLWIDGVTVSSDALTVPHPRLLDRAFAMIPLLDVAPLAVDPRSGVRLSAAIFEGDGVRATDLVLRVPASG